MYLNNYFLHLNHHLILYSPYNLPSTPFDVFLSGHTHIPVLEKREDKVFISGRSIGDINVQLILEKLGGGGHITNAGTQIEGKTIVTSCNLTKWGLENMCKVNDINAKIYSVSEYENI